MKAIIQKMPDKFDKNGKKLPMYRKRWISDEEYKKAIEEVKLKIAESIKKVEEIKGDENPGLQITSADLAETVPSSTGQEGA